MGDGMGQKERTSLANSLDFIRVLPLETVTITSGSPHNDGHRDNIKS